jgi:RNA polymerase sigma-70 factor (ECF subfamily)
LAQRESNKTGLRSDASPSDLAREGGSVSQLDWEKLSDEDLASQTVLGHAGAYEQLARRYQDRVYNLLLRMCGSEGEAEDLAQDTFMLAYRAIASFKQGSKFYTWLFRIAVNRSFSHRRQDARRRKHEGGRLDAAAGGGDGEHSVGSLIPDRHDTDPARQLDTELVRQRVREGLEQIDADYRAILVLKDIEGMDYDSIAQTLSITRAAVKSRLHRARQELARLLKDLKPETRS